MSIYVQALCSSCGSWQIEEIDADMSLGDVNCNSCGESLVLVSWDKIDDPMAHILIACDSISDVGEVPNFNDVIELPEKIYTTIEDLIPEVNRLAVARAISEAFIKVF